MGRFTTMKRLLVLLSALACGILSAAESASPAPAKPVILFVHGAWGGGWQFRKVAPLLESRGYTVYRPSLTGLGERAHLATPMVGLDTHIEDIVNVIRFENLHDVILVGHSYGGMVVTGVADRVPDRIKRVIYLDAMLPNDGDSIATLRPTEAAALLAKAHDGFIPAWWVKPDKPFPRDVPQAARTITDVLHLSHPPAAGIRWIYILTVEPGKKASEDDFAWAAERARQRGWPVLEMAADHNPEWFQPAATAELLDRACRM